MKNIINRHIAFTFIVLLLILAAAPSFVFAAPSNIKNVNVAIEMPDMFSLSWDPAHIGSSVQLTGPNRIGEYEYDMGHIDKVKGGTLVISANAMWDLDVVADADYFTGGSGIKPSSDVSIDLDAMNTYPNVLNGVSPVTIYRGMPPNTESHSLLYKINFTTLDSPGTYSLNLTYTLIKD